MGVCNCSMFCCWLLYVHFSIAIILMGTRELIALLKLSSWCLVMVERLFLAVPRGCLQFVIVVFPDHTHLLFLNGRFCNQTTNHTLIWAPLNTLSPPVIFSLTVPMSCFFKGLVYNLCFMLSVILSCLFLAALWSPAWKELHSWLPFLVIL